MCRAALMAQENVGPLLRNFGEVLAARSPVLAARAVLVPQLRRMEESPLRLDAGSMHIAVAGLGMIAQQLGDHLEEARPISGQERRRGGRHGFKLMIGK